MPSLWFYRGDDRLLEYRLRPGRTSIGRADTCDVALPGDAISRTHCLIILEEGVAEVVDRSRHGITVDGVPVPRARLADGATIGLGAYTIRYVAQGTVTAPTAEAVPSQDHEQIIAADAALHVVRASLVVTLGPDAGLRRRLDRSVVTVGGPGSDIVLRDPALTPQHVRLRVARGRAMVEPGSAAAYLDGERVRTTTPLYPGEEVRIGNTVLSVETGEDEEVPVAHRFGDMVGESRPMLALFGLLRRVAGHHAPVLVIGESGTGKELAARGIHEASSRSEGPYVPLNCGAIATNLFESELFGHERGAFTGASARKDGAFHAADGGTLFLDEVGELSEDAQAKLLRALETGEVRRVGGLAASYPDVRVVAATNRDLVAEVRAGRFREDLFFRLAVLTVTLPPLRERAGDLPMLCAALCAHIAPDASVTPEAMTLLQNHTWPGNVRELRNVLTRAYVLGGPRIGTTHLSFHDLGVRTPGAPPARPSPTAAPSATLEEAERAYILDVLARNGHNRSAAARELGVARSSLHYKMRRLGIFSR